jgi:hypothetical protein
MPTVAPKTPRETSVGFAGEPSRVFILAGVGQHERSHLVSLSFACSQAYHPLTASTSMP